MRTKTFLGVVVPPVLALGGVLVIGELSFLEALTTKFETLRWATTVVAGLWLATATGMAVYRMRRDTRAHQRLQELRDLANMPNRALVHVEAVVWRSRAGQHAVVVNVATGYRYRLWLPEVALPIGAYSVIEQHVVGVAVLDWVGRREVSAAHRHEGRHPERSDGSHPVRVVAADPEVRDDARRLIEETEQFLRQY